MATRTQIATGCNTSTGNLKSLTYELSITDRSARTPPAGPDIGTPRSNFANKAMDILDQAKRNAIQLLGHPWSKRQVSWDDAEWNQLEKNSTRYDTQSLMICCGTVTIDQPASPDRKILLIWNRNTRAWQLPKGRKDLDEDFSTAALRETTEETGIAVKPLYLKFGTRMTLPDGAIEIERQWANREGPDNGIAKLLNKDIFYACTYPDPATGAMRHIYWYAAVPQQSIVPDVDLMGRGDVSKMKAQWFSASEAARRLKMSVEREAVALATHYAEQMSAAEWKHSLNS